MQHLRLPAHSGRSVPVDHCPPCRLVWFDTLESVQLNGLGWIALLRELQEQPGTPVATVATGATMLDCPLCRRPLKPVQNQTRYGRFPALECTGCGGHLHSHAGVLAERGLVRAVLPADRGALQREGRSLCCLNCGAPAQGSETQCRYCESPLLMLDLPRLTQALRPSPGRDPETGAARAAAALWAWACHGCGAALDPGSQTHCEHCGHAVLAPSLLDLNPLLDKLEAQWRQDIASRQPASTARPTRRPRDWRDTGLARLLHRLRPDEDVGSTQAWQAALGLGLLLLWWLFF